MDPIIRKFERKVESLDQSKSFSLFYGLSMHG